jgi:CheY-like chemotaxis protein
MAETILFVDIDRQLVGALGRVFARAGYQPLEAHDGEQAVAVVEHEQPSLVVLDITLPKRDGFSVLEAIRAMPDPLCETPVLLTCGGRVTQQYEERARRLGAQGILAKPVPVKELMARADKLTGRTARARVASGEESEEFSGCITDTRLPHSLHRLHTLRATGVLVVSRARKKKAIELRNGFPVAVKSNLVTECLGHYLVRTGKLGEEAASESIARMKKSGGLQGEILVEMRAISEEEVTRALKAQAEEKLFEMFAWRRGEFRLARGSRLRRANQLAFDTSPVNIILEGIRQRTHQEDVDTFLELNQGNRLRLAASSAVGIDDIDLSEEERPIILALDGSATLGDIADTDVRRQRTLYGLVATEVLELQAVAGASKASVATETSGAGPTLRPGDRELRIELTAMAERLKDKSHFEILGVELDAGPADLEQAYQELTTRTHPYRFRAADESVRALAEDLFGKVEAAYQVLSDPAARDEYVAQQATSPAEQEPESEKASSPSRVVAGVATDRESFARVAFETGERLLREKRYEPALRELGSAREAFPRNADYVAHHAWCLYLSNPNNATVTQEALAHLRQACKLARDQEKPYLLLGRLNKVLGNNRDAESNFARAAKILPDCVEALRELRLINMRKGKTRELIGKLIRR